MAGTLGHIPASVPSAEPPQDTVIRMHNSVLASLYNSGLSLPGRPGTFDNPMPEDITRLDDSQLGSLLFMLGEKNNYIRAEMAKEKSLRDHAEIEMKRTRARVRREIQEAERHERAASRGSRMTIPDKDDLVETDDRVIQITDLYIFHETRYTLIQTIVESTELQWNTVSRRISQRQSEMDRGRRENSISHIPATSHNFRRPGS